MVCLRNRLFLCQYRHRPQYNRRSLRRDYRGHGLECHRYTNTIRHPGQPDSRRQHIRRRPQSLGQQQPGRLRTFRRRFIGLHNRNNNRRIRHIRHSSRQRRQKYTASRWPHPGQRIGQSGWRQLRHTNMGRQRRKIQHIRHHRQRYRHRWRRSGHTGFFGKLHGKPQHRRIRLTKKYRHFAQYRPDWPERCHPDRIRRNTCLGTTGRLELNGQCWKPEHIRFRRQLARCRHPSLSPKHAGCKNTSN